MDSYDNSKITLEQPFVGVWVSNMWEPYSSDRKRMDCALDDVKNMGFDCIVLDSKSSEDFFAYAETGAASDFVAMQLYMIECAARKGLKYMFLGLWAGGDNLGSWGQKVRDFDPRMPEGSRRVSPCGNETNWYNYSSHVTLDVTSRHLINLLTFLRRDNYCSLETVAGKKLLPLISHWDPSIFDFEDFFMGSYDAETVKDFRNWLNNRYKYIESLNENMNSCFNSFDDVRPPTEIYEHAQTAGNFNTRLWVDWISFLAESQQEYFVKLGETVKGEIPDVFLMPCIQQWGYLFNMESFSQISWRGVYPFEFAGCVDGLMAISLPFDSYAKADTYVVSCEARLLSSAAAFNGKAYIGGMFTGVICNNAMLYDAISPEQYVGIFAANGAQSIFCYGYNGEDDGGNLVDQPVEFKQELKEAFEWYRAVYPYIREGRTPAKVGLVFPSRTFLLEPGKDMNHGIRSELLGCCRLLTQCHVNFDFVDDKSDPCDLIKYNLLICVDHEGRPIDMSRELQEKCRTVALKNIKGLGLGEFTELLRKSGVEPFHTLFGEGVEFLEISEFENGMVLINHSDKHLVEEFNEGKHKAVKEVLSPGGEACFTGSTVTIPPRSTVFLRFEGRKSYD